MTILEHLHIMEEELQGLQRQLSLLGPDLPGDVTRAVLHCAGAATDARVKAEGTSGVPRIPRPGQSERKIDLSVRGYLETNASGMIQRTNNAASLLFNFPRHLLVGQPLLVFIKKEEREAFLRAFLELRHTAHTRRCEYLAMIHPVSMEPHLAMLIAERIEDPAHNVLGITWLVAPA